MLTTLSSLLFMVFMILGSFHFYWVLGGTWGLKQAVPTRGEDDPIQIPGKLITTFVGLVLCSFGVFYLIHSGILSIELPTKLEHYIGWILPALFIIRAIGEFKYVGMFKKVKDSDFAKADTRLFVPLCLGIGIAGLIIQFYG